MDSGVAALLFGEGGGLRGGGGGKVGDAGFFVVEGEAGFFGIGTGSGEGAGLLGEGGLGAGEL